MSDLSNQIEVAFSQVFGIPAKTGHVSALLADKKIVSKLEFLLTNSSAIAKYQTLRTLLLALVSVKKLTEMYKYPDRDTYFNRALIYLMTWYETDDARELHQIGVSQRAELGSAAGRLIQCMYKTVRTTRSNPVLFDLNLRIINLGHEYCIKGSFQGAPAFEKQAKELIAQVRKSGERKKTVFCIQCGSSLLVDVSKTPKRRCETCDKDPSNSDTKFCQSCGKSHTKPDHVTERIWNCTLLCNECKDKQ